jgi:hypothetical protein
VERKARVYKLVQAAAVEETLGVECLGVESTSSLGDLVSDISMAGRGAPKGRGRGVRNQENWPQQQQQMQPQFQQQMQPPMEFVPGSFGYPLPFFMQGAMPPPWAFGGPFQQFPPNPQFGLQSNQWIAPQQSGSQSQQQQQSQGISEQGGKGKPQAKNKKKVVSVQNNLSASSDGGLAQMNYTNSICMCCGVPGHHQATCSKPAMCFICKATNHVVENCPVRKRPH